MSSRQLDARVAMALGDAGAFMGGDAYLATQASREDIPPYSSDYTAVAVLREEAERRGVFVQYLLALIDILDVGNFPLSTLLPGSPVGTWVMNFVDLRKIMNATPEQQCRAFLRAYGVEDV